jgi:hypothetical protein
VDKYKSRLDCFEERGGGPEKRGGDIIPRFKIIFGPTNPAEGGTPNVCDRVHGESEWIGLISGFDSKKISK